MTRQYLAGELSVLLGRLQALDPHRELAGGITRLRYEAETCPLPSLASVAVSFDGGGLSLPGHLHFVSPGQINVQIPNTVNANPDLQIGFGDVVSPAGLKLPLTLQ